MDETPSTSPFKAILGDLVRRISRARGAVLVDGDGETVDSAGSMDPFALQLAGAHAQLLYRELDQAQLRLGFGRLQTVRLRAGAEGYVVRALPEGYVLVLVVHPRLALVAPASSVDLAVRELCQEAAWDDAELEQT
jgi:hypothetical protein